jgi:uncharacterized surface protein with fasciclin (FAS1) repeats
MRLRSLLNATAACSMVAVLAAPLAALAQNAAPAAPAAPAAAPPAAAAPAPAATPKVAPHGDLVETMRASGQFTTFLKAMDATNLTAVLKANQNLTVFAPTDAAFAALPAGQLQSLMANPTSLQPVITHHIINARVDAAKIKGTKGPWPSVAGNPIVLDGSGEVFTADNAHIVQSDVMASNGILHVVDAVMQPGGAPPAAPAAAAAAPAPAPAH